MFGKKRSLPCFRNKAKNNAEFEERSKDLIKEMKDISFLFGIMACVVIYQPGDPEPLVWPSKSEALAMFQHFKYLSQVEKLKKRIQELRDQLKRMREENIQKAAELFMESAFKR